MSEVSTRKRNDKTLKKLIAGVVSAVGETLGSLVDRELKVTPGSDMKCIEAADWLAATGSPKAVIRGALDKDYADKHVLVAVDLVEAITLSGCLMMTPEEVINEHRTAGTLEGDHLEAFSEVGNILCSGIDGILREVLGSNVGLRVKDHAVIKTGYDQKGFLGDDDIVVYNYTIKIGDYPETEAHIILDPDTARAWNDKKDLFVDAGGNEPSDAGGIDRSSGDLMDLEGDDEIPQAPIRGRLSAFLVGQETKSIVRRCGRRIGLEIHRHARRDIPNPAAHRGEIVLIEIPVGEEKRFDWASRIKQHHSDILVVLLIHEPSRPRVVQGFMTKANVILAWPSTEQQLSSKIDPLIAACQRNDDSEE